MGAHDTDGERDGLILREFARQAGTFEDPRLNTAFTSHLQRLVDFARPGPEDVCLDVACGTGLVGRALAVRTRHVTALDATPEMLATGKERADAEGVRNVVFQRGDAARLPFLDGSFSRRCCVARSVDALSSAGQCQIAWASSVNAASALYRAKTPFVAVSWHFEDCVRLPGGTR